MIQQGILTNYSTRGGKKKKIAYQPIKKVSRPAYPP